MNRGLRGWALRSTRAPRVIFSALAEKAPLAGSNRVGARFIALCEDSLPLIDLSSQSKSGAKSPYSKPTPPKRLRRLDSLGRAGKML
jgi:hypothetical protein